MGTVVGTVASYYCTSPRHVLVGVPKLNCRIDGSWDAALPECRLRDPEIGAPALVPNRPQKPIDGVIRRPVRKRPVPINDDDDFSRPVRRKKPIADPNPDPRFPINNEIPDSANVQANEGPNADVPLSAIQNESKSRQQQLNLGGIIALGVFGGFVFLAAIITTIVILIRRKDPGPSSSHMQHRRHHRHSHSGSSSTDTGSSREVESRGHNHCSRGYRTSEEVRDESEMVIRAVEKPKHHHHHHHHRHKHRPRESESSSKSRY